MKYTTETPRNDLVIQGVTFTIPAPFVEGHVCTGNEAAALNQLLAENVRNNSASKVNAAVFALAAAAGAVTLDDKGKPSRDLTDDELAQFRNDLNVVELQTALDEYVAEYEFGVRRGAITDPVEKEVWLMAETAVKKSLEGQGKKLKDFPKEDLRRLVEGVIEKHGEVLRKKAQTIVKARASIGAEELGITV